MSAEDLARILQTGELPAEFVAHMTTFLEEVPLQLLFAVVEDAVSDETPMEAIQARLQNLPRPSEMPAWTVAARAATLFWQHAAEDQRISAPFRAIGHHNAERLAGIVARG